MFIHRSVVSPMVRSATVIWSSLAFAVLLTTSLVAQVPDSSRVRVRYLNLAGRLREVVGTLRTLTPDSLVINGASDKVPYVVPAASISTVAVSEGMHRHVGNGALIGLGVGAIGGGLVMAGLCSGGGCVFSDEGTDATGTLVVLTGFVSGLGGAAIGALAGSYAHEHWRVVVPRRLGAASPLRLRPIVAPTFAPSRSMVVGARGPGVRVGLAGAW